MTHLITKNNVGTHIYAGKQQGDTFSRDDVQVFIGHGLGPHSDWVCTLEGSPDDPARVFVFKSRQELQDVIKALLVADNHLRRMEIDQLTNS